MKKAIIIITSLGILTLCFLFAQPQIKIKSLSGKINLSLNDKHIEVTSSKTFRLWPGKYKLRAEKEKHLTYETDVELGFFSKKDVEIKLTAELDLEKNSINEAAKNFIESWYTYNKQNDSSYLAKIKPLVTSSYFEQTYYINTQRPQDFKDQTPQKAIFISFTIGEIQRDSATGLGEFESVNLNSGQRRKLKTNLNLKKQNGEWKVDYSKTII